MRVALSAFFWVYMAVSLAAFWFAVVPVWLLLLPFDRRRRFSHWYAWTWANHYIALSPFWHVTVEGREHIAAEATHVLVSNHLSAADIMILFKLKKHFKWVAKHVLFYVPFLGWMMWMAGYVGIRRGDRASRARMLSECIAHLRRGSSIMMFPEGTRSLDGTMRDFRMGAFRLAVDAGVAVVPIVIEGTLEALPTGTWVFRHAGAHHLLVRVLEPIHPSLADGDPERLRDLVRARMLQEQAAIREHGWHRA